MNEDFSAMSSSAWLKFDDALVVSGLINESLSLGLGGTLLSM